MTLTRSPFLRQPVREAKPSPGPKPKRCASCRCEFLPRSPMARACSPTCALLLVVEERKKAERKVDRARKVALKSRSDHLKDAQVAFNAWVRERDAMQPCICCGRVATNVDGLRSHGWDAGHYRSVGSAPHLRFHEDNVHRQLVYCNRDRSGCATDYRIGLIARIGLERVEALEADQEPRRYTVEELIAIKVLYRLKLKQLKGNT